MPPTGILILSILIVLLIICSAFVSGSEVAYFSLTPTDVKALQEEDSDASKRILSLRGQPRELLATILISNNFINIAIVILSDFLIKAILPDTLMARWSAQVAAFLPANTATSSINWWINFFLTVVVVTFILVLLGEVAPKLYAKLHNVTLARRMSGVLSSLFRIFHPISRFLVTGTDFLERRLAKHSPNNSLASKEEIDQAIELTVKHEKHGAQDVDILKGIVNFGDVSVKQIMRARVDVIAVDFRTNFQSLIDVIRESGYSRIPVYDEDFDSITGILYAKDLLGYLDESDEFEWQSLIRTKVHYVPEAKKIKDLLREFQSKRIHMAIVVDEYGGSAGIVTLEDIMEEVIGDIKDEFDGDAELEFLKLDENNYVFEGKTLLNDVCRVIGIDTNTFDEVRGDADSVAGLLLEIVGFFPKKDAEFHYNDFVFKVVAVNKRRIEQIKITLPNN